MGWWAEVYRCSRSELRPARIWAGLGAMSLLCATIVTAATKSTRDGGLFETFLGIQALLLLLYGTHRVSVSVSAERSDRTWDFQRLTPLSSFDLAAGKLLGAPLYAYFLAASVLPWLFWGMLEPSMFGPMGTLPAFLCLLAVAYLTLSTGLMVSAFSETHDAGTVSAGGGMVGFAGIILFYSSVATMTVNQSALQIPFYMMRVPVGLFLIPSYLAFGTWAFLAAKWRIGKDLLDPGRLWRLPAFLIFTAWYALGWGGGEFSGTSKTLGSAAALVVCVFLLFVSAIINREGAEHWKLWLTEAQGRADRTPVWLAGWATLVLICALLGLIGPDRTLARMLIIVPAFLGRDLCFLQWCRLTESRQPEAMALVFLALGYALPPILVGVLASDLGWFHWVIPALSEKSSFVANVFPSLIHLGVMAAVLRARVGALVR